MYPEKKITCSECNKEFTWTSGEQQFMNKLFEDGKIKSVIEPKRCPSCRQAKKARYE